MEGKSGAEQPLIFRAPGRLLSSVPDGVVGQKGHFAEFLPECLRWLGISKREDFVNVPDVFRGNEAMWSNFKTSQITGESIIQNIRNKVSIFLSLTIVSFLDVIFKWHCQLNQLTVPMTTYPRCKLYCYTQAALFLGLHYKSNKSFGTNFAIENNQLWKLIGAK